MAGQKLIRPCDRSKSEQRACEILEAHRDVLERLRVNLTADFASRRRARGYVVIDHARSPKDIMHRLDLTREKPRVRRPPNPDVIQLRLSQCIEGTEILLTRMDVLVTQAGPRLYGCYSESADIDAKRLCSIATRFDDDPFAAVASGRKICACCATPLTDPMSIQRGIGPVCWGGFGKFVRTLREEGN